MKSTSSTLVRVIVIAAAIAGATGCANREVNYWLANRAAPVEPVPLPTSVVRAPSDRSPPRKESEAEGPPQEGEEQSLEARLEVPSEIPGSGVQIVRLPKKTENEETYDAAIRKLFPSLIDPPPVTDAPADVPRRKVSLTELEQLALANSPVVAQYQADITTAVGSAIQAGTHPNPIFGYESDTVGSSQNRDYQGVYMNQVIKTGGKLQLAQAIENVDLMNAQLALRQARNDLLSQIRRQYFALLIARESMKINEAVVRFTHELYRIQVDQLTQGVAAVYEPMQLRTLAVQARTSLVAARNRYIAAWKQLTATLNIPHLPLADLTDEPNLGVPVIDYDASVTHILSMHTEARAARNGPIRARLSLRLAEVTPIPDIYAYMTVQKDFTTPGLSHASYNTQLGIPLPIFDQNKGNILSARGMLVRATEEVTRVENDLRGRLAEAFERFDTSRFQVGAYRDQILPDSVRTYRGTYERHVQEPEVVGFADVVVAQQNMLNAVQTYIVALNGQWGAFVDIASLLQIDSLKELQLRLRDPGDDPQPAPAEPQPAPGVSDMMSSVLKVARSQEAAPTLESGAERAPDEKRNIPADALEVPVLEMGPDADQSGLAEDDGTLTKSTDPE